MTHLSSSAYSEWATEIAFGLVAEVDVCAFGAGEYGIRYDEAAPIIAAALIAAEKRGRIEGLKEARQHLISLFPCEQAKADMWTALVAIRARITELEKATG